MASLAVSTEPSATVRPEREPGRLRVAARETFGYFGTWLRLLWRHWPVLLAFALAGTVVRELLVDRAAEASSWRDGLGGLLVYPLIPISMLVPLVLMLRVLRPSLPYLGHRNRPEPVLVYLANVLLPFLVFYVAANYATLDYIRFGYRILGDQIYGGDLDKRLFPPSLVIAVVAVIAFGLRFVLTRTGAIRRFPWISLPAVYLEVLWIFTALFTLNLSRPAGLRWLADSRVGQATLEIWHRQLDQGTPGGAALALGRSAVSGALDSVDLALLAPVSALVAGSVVLAARARRRPEPEVSPSGLKKVFRIGMEAGRPVGGRLTLLADGLRRVFQAGVLPTMIFCVGFVALGTVSSLLFEPLRLLIGPQDRQRIWELIYFPLQWLTDAVELVLVIAFIAAFVDRTAARIARHSGAPAVPPAADVAAASARVPTPAPAPASLADLAASLPPVTEQSTLRLGPPPAPATFGQPTYAGPIAGSGTPGTPSFGGISPVTPVYTTPSAPPPTFGAFGPPPPALAPPPAGPVATPPSGLVGGLWEDGKPDVPRQAIEPGDDDEGWSALRR